MVCWKRMVWGGSSTESWAQGVQNPWVDWKPSQSEG